MNEQFEHKGHKISIEQDTDAVNPREECDQVGVMVCFHNRYSLGDKHAYKKENYSDWDELYDDIKEEHNPIVILPLYLFDHSGITISTTPFSCSWDSGQVGFIYATGENIEKLIGHEIDEAQVKKHLENEVLTYDQYLRGDVFCYNIEQEGEVVDSCGGFYGFDYCKQCAMDAV